MKLSDVPVGQLAILQERIDNEFREVYYRRTDQAARYPHHVGIERMGMVQGIPGDERPRYSVTLPTPCRDPGEADGRVVVQPLSAAKFPIFSDVLGRICRDIGRRID